MVLLDNNMKEADILKAVSDYKSRKINTAGLRRIARSFKKQFLGMNMDQRHKLVLSLYKKKEDGTDLLATYIVNLGIDEITPDRFPILDLYTDNFTGWGVTDDFCLNVIQPLLLKYPRQILSLLKKWNKSENPWKRRASVVAFVRKIGESGKFTDNCMELCGNLLRDPERLVKQGVGWALKDTLRGDRERIIKYIVDLRKLGVPSTITLYAIRDLKGKERLEVLKYPLHQ